MPTDYMTTESRLPFSLEAEQSVLGAALLDAGCVSAINLDGGGSTALAYQGKLIRSPGRELTTTLQIFTH